MTNSLQDFNDLQQTCDKSFKVNYKNFPNIPPAIFLKNKLNL